MKNTNIVLEDLFEEATVTMLLKDHHKLVTKAAELDELRRNQIEGIKVIQNDQGKVRIEYAEIPHAQEMADRIVELVVADDRLMDSLYEEYHYFFSPYVEWLNGYYTGIDLRKNEVFREAWERAKQRADLEGQNEE